MSRDYIDINDVRSFVEDWNVKYPIDRWWREKFNIPFGSPQHLSQSMLDMRIAFEEDHLFSRIEAQDYIDELNKDNPKTKYSPGTGDWLTKREVRKKMSAMEIDSVFNKILNNLDDLSSLKFGTDENGKQTLKV